MTTTTTQHPTLWDDEIETIIDAAVAINKARDHGSHFLEEARRIIDYFCGSHDENARPYLEHCMHCIA